MDQKRNEIPNEPPPVYNGYQTEMAYVNNITNPPEIGFVMNNNNPKMNENNNQNYRNNFPLPPPTTIPKLPPVIQPNTDNVENGNTSGATSGDWGDFSSLSNKVVRIKFVRKVYAILTLQLLLTFGIVAIFVFVEPVKAFAKSTAGLGVYIASYVTFFVLMIAFICLQSTKFFKKVPWNYLFLTALTIAMSFMLGMISAYHKIEAVLIAISITFVIVLGVTIFSIQTKYDFTNCWMVLLCLSLALLGMGITIGIAARYSVILQAVYGGIGACIMAIFLAVDTQLLVGGKRKMSYSPEDYINAAVQLYIDICYIFIYVLLAVGGGKK